MLQKLKKQDWALVGAVVLFLATVAGLAWFPIRTLINDYRYIQIPLNRVAYGHFGQHAIETANQNSLMSVYAGGFAITLMCIILSAIIWGCILWVCSFFWEG